MRIFLLAFLVTGTIIQEKATLTVPVALGSRSEYQVTGVSLNRPKTIGTPSGEWSLNIIYYDNKDQVYTDYHVGVFHAVNNPNGADVLVKQLNKANLSSNSLNCRALNHLITEGKIAGSTVDCTAE